MFSPCNCLFIYNEVKVMQTAKSMNYSLALWTSVYWCCLSKSHFLQFISGLQITWYQITLLRSKQATISKEECKYKPFCYPWNRVMHSTAEQILKLWNIKTPHLAASLQKNLVNFAESFPWYFRISTLNIAEYIPQTLWAISLSMFFQLLRNFFLFLVKYMFMTSYML